MKRLLVLAAAMALLAAACGGPGSGNVAIDDPWARTSAMSQTAGAVYLGLEAAESDALLSASVDAAVAATVEIHETTGDGDMMSMAPVERIELPAGESVALEPGGYHIMLLDLTEPLEDGASFDLTLEFESGESQTVEVEVRDN